MTDTFSSTNDIMKIPCKDAVSFSAQSLSWINCCFSILPGILAFFFPHSLHCNKVYKPRRSINKLFLNSKNMYQVHSTFNCNLRKRDPGRSVKPWHDRITLSKPHHQNQTADYLLLTIIYQMHINPQRKKSRKKSRLICHNITNSYDDGMDVQKVEIYFKPQ